MFNFFFESGSISKKRSSNFLVFLCISNNERQVELAHQMFVVLALSSNELCKCIRPSIIDVDYD